MSFHSPVHIHDLVYPPMHCLLLPTPTPHKVWIGKGGGGVEGYMTCDISVDTPGSGKLKHTRERQV